MIGAITMRIMTFAAILAAPLAFSMPAYAAGESDSGSSSSEAPERTQTTQDCFQARQWDPELRTYVRFSQPVNGVWDPSIRRCVRPDKTSSLPEELLEDAVRELAYAGRYDETIQVLDQMPNQSSDIVMTYRGFTARKQGNLELANVFYQDAIETNPNNILARSYMGQGFVVAGDMVAALEQLREIQARGGKGTWAETSLRSAIETGTTYDY